MDIFAIHSSSRHEKCCQMSVRLFSPFQGSKNQQCNQQAYWYINFYTQHILIKKITVPFGMLVANFIAKVSGHGKDMN